MVFFLGDPLQYQLLLLRELFLPLVVQVKSTASWPKAVSQEVRETLGKFLSSSTYFFSQVNGLTILPMPPIVDNAAPQVSARAAILQTTESVTLDAPERQPAKPAFEAIAAEWMAHARKLMVMDSSAQIKELEAKGRRPGPLFELEFWRRTYTSLTNLGTQLRSESARAVLELLKMAKSTYVDGFQKLLHDLDEAVERARDIHLHLETLRPTLQKLIAANIEELPQLFPAVLHLLALIWMTSKHFTTSRLVVVLQLVCNDITEAVTRFVDCSSLWNLDLHEVVAKLRRGLAVCGHFKSLFFNYRTQVKAACPKREWKFENSSVFLHLDAVMERMRDILEVFKHRRDFSKLDGLQLGGNRGQLYGDSLAKIVAEFDCAANAFRAIVHTILDISSPEFDLHLSDFNLKLKHL
eukprot:RCo022125